MSFETVLAGSFSADDSQLLKDVQNRLSLHADSCVLLHREEYEFVLQVHRPPGPNPPRFPVAGGAPLRARRDLILLESGQAHGNEWTLHTSQAPNRKYKKATVRSYASIPLQSGDAPAFASALGYSLTKKSTRKGFLFTLGTATISLFQIVESSPVGQTANVQLEPPSPSTWHLEVLQAVYIPTHLPKNIQLPTATYIEKNVDLILSVAVLMKGLVDLVAPES